MKRWLSVLAACVAAFMAAFMAACSAARAADSGWLTDFEAAKTQAVDRKLPILANFSGSDWCGWCIKLDKEVFSKSEFQKFATNNMVLFVADFPRRKALSPAVSKQNQALAEKYGIQGFPAVLLLDAQGKVLAETGYRPGGAEVYVVHLKTLLKGKSGKEE